MIDRSHTLGLKHQARLLNLSRSSLYYEQRQVSQMDRTPPAEAAFRLVCDPVKEFSCERS
jgi:hypothetical protein